MRISFRSIQQKMAITFSLFSSILVVAAAVSAILILNYQIERNAKSKLQSSLSQVSTDFEKGELEDSTVSFQKSNVQEKSMYADEVLPNINSRTEDDVAVGLEQINLDNLENQKNVFSRVILENGDILFTSDLFEANSIDHTRLGFRKIIPDNSGDACVYAYTAKVDTDKYENATVQVADYCSFTPHQQNRLITGIIIVGIIGAVMTYFVGLAVSIILLRSLKRAVDKTRKFTQDIYHEILTPVTVAMTTIDAAKSTKDYKKGLLSVEEDLDHVHESMTLLNTKAFRDQFVVDKSKVDISKIISDVWRSVSSKYKRNDIEVSLPSIQNIFAEINEPSLKIVLKNLFGNALKYTKDGGKAEVIAEDGRITVRNEIGDPNTISLKKFFKRDYRGKNAANKDGKGLGLAISKEICESNGWEISAGIDGGWIEVVLFI